MANNSCIGVFDSGIGGLTVVRELRRILPGENIIYVGDTARIPYGPRPPEEIRLFMKQILDFFAEQKVKLAVVACNTMTALGLDLYQGKYDFALVGMDMGAKEALRQSRSRQIGVIATAATIASGKHSQSIKALDDKVTVYPKACPRLVPLIEGEQLDGVEVEQAVREYLEPMKEAGVDTVILGCTHYPFIKQTIRKILGEDVALVDPARTTAEAARQILLRNDQLAENKQGIQRFCFSADPKKAQRIAEHILQGKLPEFELIKID